MHLFSKQCVPCLYLPLWVLQTFSMNRKFNYKLGNTSKGKPRVKRISSHYLLCLWQPTVHLHEQLAVVM